MVLSAQAASVLAISTGWKWLAVLIGLAVLVVIGLIVAIPAHGRLWQLVEGSDGRASTSKFQWLLWLGAIVFGYVVLWVLRAKQGDYSAISGIPVNLLTVLGFSTGTAAIAKGITAGYVQSNRIAQPVAGSGAKGGLIQDNNGVPDLGKVQLMAFTLIAIGIFLATLIHQIVSNPVITTMPNIDSSLLVLMGISEGGYLGNKLVTFNGPVLYPPIPPAAGAGTLVTVAGANLGSPGADAAPPPGAQLLLDGAPVTTTDWSPTQIIFTVPAEQKARTADLTVIVLGQESNAVPLTIVATGPPPSDGAVEAALSGASG